MKTFKSVLFFALISLVLLSTSQCSSAKETKKMQEKAPVAIGQGYYQYWVAGVQGGGSGVNLYLPLTAGKNNITMDTCYFRGLSTKIKLDGKTLSAAFKTPGNEERTPTSNNQSETTSTEDKKFPFDLKDNECVVSYIENGKIKYFKIENLVEKQRVDYPSAPPRNQNNN